MAGHSWNGQISSASIRPELLFQQRFRKYRFCSADERQSEMGCRHQSPSAFTDASRAGKQTALPTHIAVKH